MANTKKYLSHLLQNTGITPACSEEERMAAEMIAKIFSDHGFQPEVQEFTASGSAKVAQAVVGIAAFLGAVLAGISGAVGIVGFVLAVAAAVIFTLERTGRPVISQLGRGGLSQNVIAYHKASGPLASPRNRPVVVVAHYDSPRADLLCQEPMNAYRPLIAKLLPLAIVAVAVLSLVRLLPVPDAAKLVMWIVMILLSLVPLASAVSIIANRFVLPYTTGSVCNKSSVAAMLGVMDAVAPFERGDEFPSDVPAEEYFAEQRRIVEEARAVAAAEAAAAEAAAMSYPHEEAAAAAAAEKELLQAELVDETTEPGDSFAAQNTVAQGTVAGAAAPVVPSPADTMVTTLPGTADVASAGVAVEEAEAPAAMPADETVQFSALDVAAAAAEVSEAVEAPAADDADALEVDDAIEESEAPYALNSEGNIRFGAEAIRSLGMLSSSCNLVYEPDDEPQEEVQDKTQNESASEVPMAAVELPAADGFPMADDALETDEVLESYAEDAAYAPADVAEESWDEEPEGFEEPVDGAPFDAEEAVPAPAPTIMMPQPVEAVPAVEPIDESLYAPESEDDWIMEAEYEVLPDEDEPAAQTEASAEDDLGATMISQPVTEDEVADHAAAEAEPDVTVVSEPIEQSEGGSQETADVEPSEDEGLAVEDEAPAVDDGAELHEPESTQIFTVEPSDSPDASENDGRTMAMPAQPAETVDSLMAQIAQPEPKAAPQRALDLPNPASTTIPTAPANRAALFDLPDPSSSPFDPLGAPAQQPAQPASAQAGDAQSSFAVIGAAGDGAPTPEAERFETISAPAPQQEKPKKGLARLFGRKKKSDDSMSQWLGVEDDFDAKRSGGDIGSWDNFDDDDMGWKGGAVGTESMSEDELREAITSMGDDELLGHDIWFVATGASENGNAGIQAFLNTHRAKLRGVFLINLECVGSGQIAMLSSEGERRVLKGDKRISRLVSQVSSAFHHEFVAIDMPYVTTDAHAAMSMSLRSLTIAGVDGNGFALSHTEADQPYNVDPENVALVSDVVTEVIRRS